MPDDLRARISRLTRDVEKAVEIGYVKPEPRGELPPGWWDGFCRLWGHTGEKLSNADMPKAEPGGPDESVKSRVDFDFAGFATMYALSQPDDPPVTSCSRPEHEPTIAPEPSPAAQNAPEKTVRPVAAPMNELNLAPVIVAGESD